MKALLDTHAFLWWINDDPRLSDTARELIGDGESELFLERGQRLGDRDQNAAWRGSKCKEIPNTLSSSSLP